MAQTYTRQSSFADGDTITAALFNNEYNQLVNAFAYSSSSASSTGHRHDGTAGQPFVIVVCQGKRLCEKPLENVGAIHAY